MITPVVCQYETVFVPTLLSSQLVAMEKLNHRKEASTYYVLALFNDIHFLPCLMEMPVTHCLRFGKNSIEIYIQLFNQ